jgi:hypothetical protein
LPTLDPLRGFSVWRQKNGAANVPPPADVSPCVEVSARTRNALLVGIGVPAALVVVAVASRGSTPAGDDRARGPGDTLLDVFFTLYLAAMAAGAVLFVYLLVLRRHVRVQSGRAKRRNLLELLGTMLALMLIGTLLARRLVTYDRRPPLEEEVDQIGRGGGVPTITTSPDATSYEPGFSWLPALATGGLIVLAVLGWWLSGRARKRARGELRSGLATAVARAVDESLDDLRAEPDPRRAVIAAYARLEQVLASHELPRLAAEAPFEYLARMLAELEVSEAAARALTDLFERAKFSQHAVGPEMKAEAIAALETVRDELRAARELAEQARRQAVAAGGPGVAAER